MFMHKNIYEPNSNKNNNDTDNTIAIKAAGSIMGSGVPC